MARELEKRRPGPSAVLMADRREGQDLWGAAEAMRPLADLCLSGDAETPFALALVGGAGAGKSFALRRLVEAIGSRARPPLLSKIVVAEVDGVAGDPSSAVAAAVFSALERDNGGVSYAALADEAAHAAVDPRHAATTAVERHDEIVARLEQERRARDELEARRARLTETLLFESPGSRIDAFIRTGRSAIETRLRRFGFVDGAADVSFRRLVGDLAGARASSRLGLFLRAIWAYRGQSGLIVLAILCLALAFCVDRLRQPAVDQALQGLSPQLAPALSWVQAHDQALEYAGEALIVAGIAALFVNLWRAASFTSLLFRGLRMLNLDLRERRRELDASAARLERRVASLQMEADAAGQRAEAMARRAGGSPAARPAAPAFLARADAPERAARAFLDDLGRAMAATTSPAPQRLIIVIDGLDALPPPAALRFLEVAVRIAGRGCVVLAAADLARLGDAREIAERLFEVVYEVAAPADSLAARWLSTGPLPVGEAPSGELGGALDETEVGFLQTAAALVGARPRALKRFYNAYRLARLGAAPRGALALSLAALMAPDGEPAAALRWALAGEGELAAPSGPPALRAAFTGLGVAGIGKAAARQAFEAARRYAPWG